jgi:hypothetical protein
MFFSKNGNVQSLILELKSLKKAANYIRTNVEAFAEEILLETENSVESHKVKNFY